MIIKLCKFCNKSYKVLDSSFCCQLCFDEYHSLEIYSIPQYIIDKVINAMKKSK